MKQSNVNQYLFTTEIKRDELSALSVTYLYITPFAANNPDLCYIPKDSIINRVIRGKAHTPFLDVIVKECEKMGLIPVLKIMAINCYGELVPDGWTVCLTDRDNDPVAECAEGHCVVVADAMDDAAFTEGWELVEDDHKICDEEVSAKDKLAAQTCLIAAVRNITRGFVD